MTVVQLRPIFLGRKVEAVKNSRALRHAPIAPKMDSVSKEFPGMLQELPHHPFSHVFIRPESKAFRDFLFK
jgi:hypothetical protein